MSAQVAALKQAGVKAVVISAGPRQAASLVGVAAASGFNVPIVGNNSAFAPQLLAHPGGPGPDEGLLRRLLHPAHRRPGAPARRSSRRTTRPPYPKDGLDNGVVAGYTAASVFGEALKKACAAKDLTREGVDKALLTISSYDNGFGITHDFSDPTAPSTRQSVIMKPDAKVPGGLKVVRPATVAKAAESYKAGG